MVPGRIENLALLGSESLVPGRGQPLAVAEDETPSWLAGQAREHRPVTPRGR